MPNSQNGWPARQNTKTLTRFTAAGQGWWAHNEDVATVFKEFIERFDAEVEEVTQNVLDDWSYANRLIRDSLTTISNHGSATAIDVNALDHPRGKRNTFSPAKRGKMHDIRNSITDNSGKPVLDLGMDYKFTADDMHVEIGRGVTPKQVKEAADKIREKNMAAKLGKEELAAIQGLIEKALKETQLVENKPTEKQRLENPKVGATTYSVADAIANIEYDVDNNYNKIVERLNRIIDLLESKNA